MSVEASVFYNDYDDLRSQEATPLITLANLYDGHTTGVELAGNVQPHARWLVHASYTGQRVSLKPLARAAATRPTRAPRPTIRRTCFSMRSYLNLPHDLELDGFFRAVGKLRASNLPGYQELDMRIGWQATDRLELSIMGRDLLHPRHAEFAGGSAQPRYFQREVALRVTFADEMSRPLVASARAGTSRAIVCAIAVPVRAQSSLEYNVKAALLLNFARFIEWPDRAFAGASAPIEICVFAPNPFGEALDRALEGETVANRTLSARDVRTACRQRRLSYAVRAGRR